MKLVQILPGILVSFHLYCDDLCPQGHPAFKKNTVFKCECIRFRWLRSPHTGPRIWYISHTVLNHMLQQKAPNSQSAMFGLHLTVFIYVCIYYVTCLMCAMLTVRFLFLLWQFNHHSQWQGQHQQITCIKCWQIRANWVVLYTKHLAFPAPYLLLSVLIALH